MKKFQINTYKILRVEELDTENGFKIGEIVEGYIKIIPTTNLELVEVLILQNSNKCILTNKVKKLTVFEKAEELLRIKRLNLDAFELIDLLNKFNITIKEVEDELENACVNANYIPVGEEVEVVDKLIDRKEYLLERIFSTNTKIDFTKMSRKINN